MNHQILFNKKFYLDKKTGYWISTSCPKIRAHVHVWRTLKGEIPKGYHVHHINKDKSDNRIENLSIMKASDHLSFHSKQNLSNEKYRERLRRHLGSIRNKASEWHKSDEGRAWHKLHAIKCKFGKNPIKEYKCEVCFCDFKSSVVSRFCCNNCKSAWRRRSGIDDVNASCKKCGELFKKNKYSKQMFCSRECVPRKKALSLDERVCEYCGKVFRTERYKKKRFCGYKCSAKWSYKGKKASLN